MKHIIPQYNEGDRILVSRNIRPKGDNHAIIISVMKNKPNLYRIQYDGTKVSGIKTIHANHFSLNTQ